jgi:hypothetical protein
VFGGPKLGQAKRLLTVFDRALVESYDVEDTATMDATAMTVTIELPDEQAAALKARADAEGLSLAEWIRKLAEESATATRPRRHISEIIRENMSRVPPEIMATLPKDGASEIDHYLYGHPKRNQ